MNDTHPMNTCVATNRAGTRCKRRPIPGGTVCNLHGGKAPQVQRAARLRLIELIDPAIATLAREMAKAEKSNDRQAAANSILDRAGIPRRAEVTSDDAKHLLYEMLRRRRDQPDTSVEVEPIDVEVIE